MARLTVLIEPINATPKNFPVSQLHMLLPALERYLKNDIGKTLQKDMEATVKNWKTAPTMEMKVTKPYGTRLQLTVEPKGRGSTNWKRISEGTGPRPIRAKTPRGMSFQSKYTPKTTPGGRYGGPGKKYGKWRRRVMLVKRHRIAPRKFAPKIMKRRQNEIHNGVRKVVRTIATKRGLL